MSIPRPLPVHHGPSPVPTTLTDTASLTVNPGPLHHIVISPDNATIIAGNTGTYTSQSFDQFSNPIADISSSTVFSIEAGAGGSWAINIYTSAKAGTWTVTGTYIGLTDNASLTVSAGALHHIVISPDSAAITAGNTQTYGSQSFDQFDNLIADVTATTVFSITPAAGGTWAANVYTSEKAGLWAVSGTYSGNIDTATLAVSAGPLHHIVISPGSATIIAGNTQAYTAQTYDQFDNAPRGCHRHYGLLRRTGRRWRLGRQCLHLSQRRHLDGHR